VADNLSKEKRSKIMRSIRSKNTGPELLVRKILTAMGYRYRLHRKDIPGCPDIAFIRRKKAIFVNGCFWHAHDNCPIAHIPDSKFWRKKLAANKKRDGRALSNLKSIRWNSLTLWECELRNNQRIRNVLSKFLR
jgi:DNA mismatch endonuclease (patch repair protein)